jgi:protocatechuate 3,4-dioxygenase beta subunit
MHKHFISQAGSTIRIVLIAFTFLFTLGSVVFTSTIASRTVTASPIDTTPPTINSFSVNPLNVVPGNPFTISYTVSDSGGSGLSRVELWRATDAGGTPRNWAEVRRNAASGNGPLLGSFSETLQPGVYWYGLHVVDNSLNFRVEPNPPGPIRVIVNASDTISPTIIAFSASPGTVAPGSPVTISYTVSDSGGSGLNRVELWRANDAAGTPSSWAEVRRNSASGNGPIPGSFSETLPVGVYWYGLHVRDNAGNVRFEPNPPGPLRVSVRVSPDTTSPIIEAFSVNPSTVTPGNRFTISYTVSDSGGSGLSRVELWRANDSGGPINWAEVRRNPASSNGPISGSFTETLPSGVYWYGLHAVDNSLNFSRERAPIRVMVSNSPDTIPPTINAFSVNPTNVGTGNTITISYTVSDSGGSGLSRVELWRASDSGGTPRNWAEVRRNPASGGGPTSGSFTETLSPGVYWYGLHAVDNGLNFRVEAAPIRVTVRSSTDTTPPAISAFSVNTTNVMPGSPVTISYTVSDSGGSGLNRVELWRANDAAGTPSSWAEVRRNSASGNGPIPGSFSETLPVGVYWYGLHVVDNALNFRVEPAPIKVTVRNILDTTLPTINAFSVSPTSVRPNNPITISYRVTDSGGSGLNRVELWRANDAGGIPINWAEVRRNAASGNGAVSGSFTETPQPGVYWYSVHVWDSAGNMRSEPNPPGPIRVTVSNSRDTIPPTINSFSINPLNVVPSNPITISYRVSDSGGSGLSRVELWRAIDVGGTPRNWAEVRRNAASGNGAVSGSFTETLPSGVYWYGLHAVDNALNFRVESAPIRVTVSSDSGGLRINQPNQGQVFSISQQNLTATGPITFEAAGNISNTRVIWNVILDYQTTGGPRGIPPKQRSFQTINTPFQDMFKSMGGRLTINAQAVIGGQPRNTTVTAYIMGASIPDSAITARLVDLYRINDLSRPGATPRLLTGIASRESSYAQFWTLTLYGQRGLWPRESEQDNGSHIGLMQVSIADPPIMTAMEMAWDWQLNAEAGYRLFLDKLRAARLLTRTQIQTYPGLRELNETEIENVALVLYGPGASRQELYYHPVRTASGRWDWEINWSGNPVGVSYADDCRRKMK